MPWNMLFNKNAQDMMNNFQMKDFQPYLEKMFSQVMPQNLNSFSNEQNTPSFFFNPKESGVTVENKILGASVFETHEHVFVRIPLKESDIIKKIRIFHTSNQLILEGIPSKDDRQVITLPSIVKKKGSTAIYKDRTLEIKIPKNTDMQYSEIDVSQI